MVRAEPSEHDRHRQRDPRAPAGERQRDQGGAEQDVGQRVSEGRHDLGRAPGGRAVESHEALERRGVEPAHSRRPEGQAPGDDEAAQAGERGGEGVAGRRDHAPEGTDDSLRWG